MSIIIVSPNVSMRMGGEALKVFQYVRYLRDRGAAVHVLTHSRCRAELARAFPASMLTFVEDDTWQRFLWRSGVLGPLVTPYFHLAARRILRGRRGDHIVHYVCPISPLEPRFVPQEFPAVIGPLNGNLTYPPAFRGRAGWKVRLHAAIYGIVGRALAPALRSERRHAIMLVSGGGRTVSLLRDVAPDRILEVADFGVADAMLHRDPVAHAGRNGAFYTCARLIDLKGIDLAIKAIARCEPDVTLDVIGDGPHRDTLVALAEATGLRDRVRFRGWIGHEELAAELRRFRGFVFPSLCEANGIVMQEAMMCGIPVIALRWGGPEMLADDASAILIDPAGEEAVIEHLARAMTELAADHQGANRIAAAARARAEAAFSWHAVGNAWSRAYAMTAPAYDIIGTSVTAEQIAPG